MKKFLTTIFVSFALSCSLAFAHHAADGIVDDEIYEQIGNLIEDTEHAELTLDDLTSGSTVLTIEIEDAETFDQLVDAGLLELIDDLEGNTTIIPSEDSYDIIVVNTGNNITDENTEDNYAGGDNGSWDDEMN